MFDLHQLFGLMLDGVGDRVAVGLPQRERSRDQQVERPLQQIALNRRISGVSA